MDSAAYLSLLPLRTERLELVPPSDALAAAISDFHVRNFEHFLPWVPRRAADYDSPPAWVERVQEQLTSMQQGASLNLFLTLAQRPGRVVGHVALSNIVRRAFQAAHLGYSIDREHQGQGLMREAVQAVTDFAFGPMQLHRVMANYILDNARSGAVLQHLGFEIEGRARAYLHINGEWRDHVLTSKIAPE